MLFIPFLTSFLQFKGQGHQSESLGTYTVTPVKAGTEHSSGTRGVLPCPLKHPLVTRRSVRKEDYAAGKHSLSFSISQGPLRAVQSSVEPRLEWTFQVTCSHSAPLTEVMGGCPLAAPVTPGAGDGSCSAAWQDVTTCSSEP